MTDQELADELLGRPLLEGLGLDNSSFLATTADCFSGSVDGDSLLCSISEEGDERV